jgi:hypothetical protein
MPSALYGRRLLDPIGQSLQRSIRTGTWQVLPFPPRQATIGGKDDLRGDEQYRGTTRANGRDE